MDVRSIPEQEMSILDVAVDQETMFFIPGASQQQLLRNDISDELLKAMKKTWR